MGLCRFFIKNGKKLLKNKFLKNLIYKTFWTKNGKNGTKMAQNPKIIEFYPKNAQKYPKNSQKWPKNAQNSVSFLCRFCVVFRFVSFFSRFLQIFTSPTNTNFSQVLHKK